MGGFLEEVAASCHVLSDYMIPFIPIGQRSHSWFSLFTVVML